MAGPWYILVPEAATNKVLNPSAEADGNYSIFAGSGSTSPSGSVSPSASASKSASASSSKSPSASASPSASQSKSPSASASPSSSKSASASASSSPSSSASASASPSAAFSGVSRVTTHARAGDYCYQVNVASTNDGGEFTLSALSNAIHYVSFYARGNAAATLEAALNGGTFNAAAVIGGATGGWVRYGVQVPAAQASGSVEVSIRNTADEDFFLDCIQVEAASYPTTYIDGDQGPLYRWTGLRHGSTSTRDAQERSGGRERNLYDDFGISVNDGSKRIGMPPLLHNLQAQALQPGAVFQSTKILPREIELRLTYEGTGADYTAAWANFHALRQDLIDILKPDAVRGNQPVIIGYAGADSGTKVYGSFYYTSGLEFGDFMAFTDQPTVKLLAVDPFWYEDNRETASLDFTDSVASADFALRRQDGQWSALGSGMNGTVYVVVADKQLGRIYYGGDFTTANGVTVNRICYWNGTNFVAMGSTPGVAGGAVYSIAIAPNGDVWVGGAFTTADGSTADGLARWNLSTGNWTAFANGTPGNIIYSMVIDGSGNLYGGGNFTNWNGDGAQDYIWKYDGSAFSALGTSPFTANNYPGLFQSLTLDAAGNLWTGEFTSALAASVRKWDGSTWTTVITTNDPASIFAVHFDDDGTLFVGGTFTTLGGISVSRVASYNGISVNALGSGVNGNVISFLKIPAGLLVGGSFTIAGGLALADQMALWNGTTWTHIDVDLPGSPLPYGSALFQDTLYIGYSSSGTALAAGITIVTNGGTTGVFPDITIIGPASPTATLQSIENQSSDEKLYFNLIVNNLEVIEISLQPGNKQVASLWSGRPGVGRRSRVVTRGQPIPQRASGIIRGQPLANSDFAAFHLQSGANTVAAFITGSVAGVEVLMHWVPKHWGVDGPA